MTNRSKHVRSHRPLRYLDLSFEGRQQANTAGVNNGVRPHGGNRGRRKHPLYYLSHDKPVDYHKQLRHDIDMLLEEEVLEVHGSPSWVCDANREINHSGESPLIVNKFLAASKVQTPRSAGSSRRPWSAKVSNKYGAPPTRESVEYYRPNRTHQYLTTTDLKDCSQDETNLKYGRPTRTTLLRARQRSNSAPINAYEIRREMTRRAEERQAKKYTFHTSEMLQINTGSGETAHSWLIGARYNRAHYVDAKSFNLYGMYMPRNNLMGTFVTHSVTNLLKDVDNESYPATPPDTPRSDEDDMSTNYQSYQRVTSAPLRRQHLGYSSPPSTRHAWEDSQYSVQLDHEKEVVERQNRGQFIEQLIDGPNITAGGSRMAGAKVKLHTAKVEQGERSILPVVQGMSWRSPRRKAPRDPGANQQPPPPSPAKQQSLKDFSENLKLEDLIVKTTLTPKGPLSASSKSLVEPHREEGAPQPKKTKPILVDRSVNCPSIPGDADLIGEPEVQNTSAPRKVGAESEMKGEMKTASLPGPVVETDTTTQMDQSEAEKESTRGNTSMEVRGESFVVSERSLEKECTDEYKDKETSEIPADVPFQNNATFFMTENGHEKTPQNVDRLLPRIEETILRENDELVLQEFINTVLAETEKTLLEEADSVEGKITGTAPEPQEGLQENFAGEKLDDRTLPETQNNNNGHAEMYESYEDQFDDKETAYKITVDICKKNETH